MFSIKRMLPVPLLVEQGRCNFLACRLRWQEGGGAQIPHAPQGGVPGPGLMLPNFATALARRGSILHTGGIHEKGNKAWRAINKKLLLPFLHLFLRMSRLSVCRLTLSNWPMMRLSFV